MTIELTRTIRGTQIVFHADDFHEDPSVGIPLGPQQTWAETLDGQEFELTEDEDLKLSIEATDAFLSRVSDAFYDE